MEELIQRQLQQIKDLEQRKILKEVLEQILIPFYESNQQMYQELEEKIKRELSPEIKQYDIFCTLIKKEDFPLFINQFSPVLGQDLEETEYELKENGLLQGIRIFLECDYLQLKEMLKEERTFSGTIKRGKNIYKAEFALKLSPSYIEELYHLYQLFVQNNISWKTIFAPYLFKMADVFLIKEIEEQKKEENAPITETDINFGEYAKYIKYDVFPIWNIKKQMMGSVGFAMPCEDHKTYQHIISMEGLNNKDGYLIENTNYEIQEIERQLSSFAVTCNTDEVQEWNIYQVCGIEREERIGQKKYPMFHNRQKDSFAEKLSKKNHIVIRTQAELIRLLDSFDYQEYLEYEGYEIQQKNKKEVIQTYSVNPFISDEIRHQNAEKIFQVTMRMKKKNNIFTRDVLSFLISEIQLRLPEYECRGKIV